MLRLVARKVNFCRCTCSQRLTLFWHSLKDHSILLQTDSPFRGYLLATRHNTVQVARPLHIFDMDGQMYCGAFYEAPSTIANSSHPFSYSPSLVTSIPPLPLPPVTISIPFPSLLNRLDSPLTSSYPTSSKQVIQWVLQQCRKDFATKHTTAFI